MSILQLENIRHAATVDLVLGCLCLIAGITGLTMLWLSRSAARAEIREIRARRAFLRYMKRR